VPLAKKAVYCRIICGDSRDVLHSLSEKANLIVTSPPYADARKLHYDSIPPNEFSDWFLTFSKVFWKALDSQGSLVLNVKDKVVKGVRHRFVWETVSKLQTEGWKSVDDYIWQKSNPVPGYWPNRLRDGWEYCFHLAKTTQPKMYQSHVKVPIGGWTEARMSNLKGKDLSRHNSENGSGFGRDLREWVGKRKVLPTNVISLPLVGKNFGHPAAFPISLPAFFISLFTQKYNLVVDPFGGSGSTGIAAINLHRNSILIDNNKAYCRAAYKRIKAESNLNGTRVIKEGF
jgi:site-specific DNA-methyltransferase (adenine-specific)